VDEQVGSEPSTNFRWWDLQILSGRLCRLDLNHPPTPVGGISEFSHSRYREVVLTCSIAQLKLVDNVVMKNDP
jgi:hypothetical protein